MPSNYLQWIRKDPRPKSEIFICPFCYNEVWSRTRNEQKEVVCTYSFCPHCGKQIGYEFLPYQRLLQWFALPKNKANHLILYLTRFRSNEIQEILTMLIQQNHMHDMYIYPKQNPATLTAREYLEYMKKGGDTNACKEENNGSTEGSEKDTAQ